LTPAQSRRKAQNRAAYVLPRYSLILPFPLVCGAPAYLLGRIGLPK
jgi:hypothetical protein